MRASYPPEPATGRTNQELTLYQALLARYDGLGNPERVDLVELVALFADGTTSDRELLLRVARAIVRR